MKKLCQSAAFNSCYRYVGEGPANGVLHRVLLVYREPNAKGTMVTHVITVQESREPRYSWSGTLEEFCYQFVFTVGPMISAHRRF